MPPDKLTADRCDVAEADKEIPVTITEVLETYRSAKVKALSEVIKCFSPNQPEETQPGEPRSCERISWENQMALLHCAETIGDMAMAIAGASSLKIKARRLPPAERKEVETLIDDVVKMAQQANKSNIGV